MCERQIDGPQLFLDTKSSTQFSTTRAIQKLLAGVQADIVFPDLTTKVSFGDLKKSYVTKERERGVKDVVNTLKTAFSLDVAHELGGLPIIVIEQEEGGIYQNS